MVTAEDVLLAGGLNFPKADGSVLTGRHQPGPPRGESKSVDTFVMAMKRRDLSASGKFPNPDSSGSDSGRYKPRIRRERDVRRAETKGELEPKLALIEIPQEKPIIATNRSHRLSIWSE